MTLRPEFSGLKNFTANLPKAFDRQGLVIYNSRNVIKKIQTDQGTFVVKNFKGMYFFNRLAYSLFRKSKAARSYDYSAILNKMGIMTPPHVAWIDCYSMGLLTKSYFVNVYYPFQTLGQALEYYNLYNPTYKKKLLADLARFVFRLHGLKIFQKDLSLGNFLVVPKPDAYDFAMVDLNRISFRRVNFREGLMNLTKLGMSDEDLDLLISEYARLSGQPVESSVAMFWKIKRRASAFRELKRAIRKHTLAPIEALFRRHHVL